MVRKRLHFPFRLIVQYLYDKRLKRKRKKQPCLKNAGAAFEQKRFILD